MKWNLFKNEERQIVEKVATQLSHIFQQYNLRLRSTFLDLDVIDESLNALCPAHVP